VRVELTGKSLIGIQSTGPSSFSDSSEPGQKFGERAWQQLVAVMLEQGLTVQRELFGVSWPADESVPPQQIHYFTGFEPQGGEDRSVFASLDIQQGAFFEYVYIGSPHDIDAGFINAYMTEMPNSGLTPRAGQHVEHYSDDYSPMAEVVSFRILIPVE
jgi:predicted transcriptional regulator YdeE